MGLEAGLETEAGSRDPIDKAGTSETETWAAETKTETDAIKIRSVLETSIPAHNEALICTIQV